MAGALIGGYLAFLTLALLFLHWCGHADPPPSAPRRSPWPPDTEPEDAHRPETALEEAA
jgi:hypothetical protein